MDTIDNFPMNPGSENIPEPERPSLRSRIANIYHTARAEHADASTSARVGMVATVGALGFEWGTGNEALLSYVGANVHRLSDSPIVTGLTTGAASVVEQGALGALMAITISNFPKVADAVREAVAPGKEQDTSKQSKLGRFGSVMVLGSAVELAKENAQRQHSRSENVRRGLASAALIGAGNTAIFSGVSEALRLGSEHGFEPQVETFVNFASNPLTYAGIFGGVIAFNKLKPKVAGVSTAAYGKVKSAAAATSHKLTSMFHRQHEE